jgi:hypothetical protein
MKETGARSRYRLDFLGSTATPIEVDTLEPLPQMHGQIIRDRKVRQETNRWGDLFL